MNNVEAYAYIWEVPGRIVAAPGGTQFKFCVTQMGDLKLLQERVGGEDWTANSSAISDLFQNYDFEAVERELPKAVVDAILESQIVDGSLGVDCLIDRLVRITLDAIGYEY